MRRSAVLLALALVAGLPGCNKKKDEARSTPASSARPPGAPVSPEGSRKAASRVANFPRLALALLTVEEITPMLPTVVGARALGGPVSQAGGRQVRQSHCMASADLVAAGEAVRAAITERGFTASQPQQRGKADRPRVVISAQKDDYRLSANLLPSSNPECVGKAEALITFHRVIKKEPGAAPLPAPGAAPAERVAPEGE